MKSPTPQPRRARLAAVLLLLLGPGFQSQTRGQLLEPGFPHDQESIRQIETPFAWENEQEKPLPRRAKLRSPRQLEDCVEFRYRDQDYQQVHLSGGFTHWQPEPMSLVDGDWVVAVELPPGRYLYRFEVSDSQGDFQAIDPENPATIKDLAHGWVSVVVAVEDPEPWIIKDWGDHSYRDRARDELEEDDEFEFLWLDYQRVDGLSLGFTLNHYADEEFEPSARARISYGFRSKSWTLGCDVLQPLVPKNRLWLKLGGWSGTDYSDQTGVGDLENTLAAMFFADDYRDYYWREGGSLSLVHRAQRWMRVEAGVNTNNYESLERKASWSWGKGGFLQNPPVDEGTLRTLFGRVRVGRPESNVEVRYEKSAEQLLGGDFYYSRIVAEYRSELRLGPSQYLGLRLKAGDTLTGDLPRQRRFVVGGFGTVRAYPYQSLVVPATDGGELLPYGGERMLLANLDYTFSLDIVDLSLLWDAGMAWESAGTSMELDQLRDSAGLGFSFDEGDIHLNVMKALDGENRDPVWELRITSSF